MMKIVLIIILVVAVTAFPTLYKACAVPSSGFGLHGSPVIGFGDKFTFSFTNTDGSAAKTFTSGKEYLVTVTGTVPFRMAVFANAGSFVFSDATGEPTCDGLRVNFNDLIPSLTAIWMADAARNVTFAVNLAGACPNNYVQGSLFIEAAI